jgi:hypothetical protein
VAALKSYARIVEQGEPLAGVGSATQKCGQTLIGFGRGAAFCVYSHRQRIGGWRLDLDNQPGTARCCCRDAGPVGRPNTENDDEIGH